MATILTVDDSATIRQMVSFALKAAGYQVVEASNGQEAISKVSAQQVNLVITDLNMPLMNGVELTRRLRAMPQYRFTPILLLTTESEPEKKQAGKAAGATGWLVKPFVPEQLLAVVKKVVH